MPKNILYVLLALTLIASMVAFVACGEEEEIETDEWQWPERLLLPSLSTQSPTYGSQVSWSTPFSEDTGVAVRIITESNSQRITLWVKEGRVFCTAPHQNRGMMYGNKGFTRRDAGAFLSAIWYPAGVSYWSFAALGDSSIETPYDIKPGMKSVLITTAEEPQQSIYALLAWAQVDYEDITFVPLGSTAQTGRFLQDGKADFALAYTTSSYWFELEASPHGLTFLELDWENDPDGAQRFLDMYPYTGWGVASGGAPSSEGVRMCRTLVPFITRAENDPELVYRIVKWLGENYDRYKDGHPWCASMTIDNLVSLAEEHYEPLHDGAVRYLEELGLWTEELEARRQYNTEQLTKWVDAYETAVEMADDKGITVDPENDEWQEFWENYRDSLNLPLLVLFQGPGKEQPTHMDYYSEWERIRPLQD